MLSAEGKAKWDKHDALVISGRITPYCSVRLGRKDYEYNAFDAVADIHDFAQQEIEQTVVKNKKRKFMVNEMIVKIKNMFQRIS